MSDQGALFEGWDTPAAAAPREGRRGQAGLARRLYLVARLSRGPHLEPVAILGDEQEALRMGEGEHLRLGAPVIVWSWAVSARVVLRGQDHLGVDIEVVGGSQRAVKEWPGTKVWGRVDASRPE